ncbi:uncharacterized protein PFL1_01029 [Pseudozyma flocculosa PF-1]|uniref:Related to PPX1 - Exopolyphosphatase n=1 Tax=Pseudozyma flocculosa TaxID=84751 RepID=A0A5C3F8L8_9BASI|nr:uncharacterized protein PFL1_01029 [Pseudozyma flocculosa PF-1]EPQ31696.1 hypothetical protein PFL1_01029 [Pseudozyma flocculosa PF-1]SPO40813.1 related to PPX1 - Exopolyphosphatase [Pseudozyma flocculosa]
MVNLVRGSIGVAALFALFHATTSALPTAPGRGTSGRDNGAGSSSSSSHDIDIDSSFPLFGIQTSRQQAAFHAPGSGFETFGHVSYPSDYWALEEGVGHFSEWSKATKHAFLRDWRDGRVDEWTLVMGNEGGDLDSMTAALTWAYHLSHSTLHHPEPRKVVALLQTPADALDLRPENQLALHNIKMSSGHRDLLTIDELPEKPVQLAPKVEGIVLVDHPVPLRVWNGAKILSIFDHHTDRGAAPNAEPRVFGTTASCTTLVAKQMLDELEALPSPPGEYHVPHEVYELILDAIAIDSDGLNPKKSVPLDREVSERVLKRSNWHNESLTEVMDRLDSELGKAKKDLDHLNVRDLLRRDWKGDVVDTISPRTPAVHLGFASTPVPLDEQIKRTRHKQVASWFDIEDHWTAEIGADISLCLNSYKVKIDDDGVEQFILDDEDKDEPEDEDGGVGTMKKQKIREIILVVRHDRRIDEEQANSLFETVSRAIEADETLKVEKWHRADELRGRRMAWRHYREDAGRKVVRPIVEEAVRNWDA